MTVLALLLLLVVFLGMWVIWIGAIVHAARIPPHAYPHAGRSRGSTIALVALTGIVGAGYYWLVIRRELAPRRVAAPRVRVNGGDVVGPSRAS